LSDEHHDLVYRRPVDARVPSPAIARRVDDRACRGRQRHRAVLVDPLAVIGAAFGSGAVQLPVAGMGNDPRLCGVGDMPTPGLLVGSAIVVASGLYILWRETVHRRRRAVLAPQRG